MILNEVTETELIKLQKTLAKSTRRPLANRTIRAMETIFKGFLKDLTGQTNSHRLTYDPLAHVKSIKIKDAPFCKKNEPEGWTKYYKKEIKKIEQKILNCLG